MVISGWPLVSLLIIFPFVGALGCACPLLSKKYDPNGSIARVWAVSIASINLAFILALSSFLRTSDAATIAKPFLIHETHTWMPAFGVSFTFVLDGLSYLFCLLTAFVSFVVILWSQQPQSVRGERSYSRAWYAMLLAAEGGVMGAFLATDLLLFYVFYELMLLPVLVGIGLWGGSGRAKATFTFAIYTLAASVLMFVAILYCAWRAKTAGAFSFDVADLVGRNLFSPREQVFLGAAFLLAFAVKIPIVPFHSWLPGAYREAPHGVAAFTAALLGKVGIYAILRFAWPLFPYFVSNYGYLIGALGAVGVAYGALIAMQQKDLRLLLAYSSISHLGFCVLGLAALSPIAVAGAVFQSFSHGLVTAALFLTLGLLIDIRQSRNFVDFGGLAVRLPLLAFFLMVFSIAAVALPLTSSFVGEFMVLLGAYAKFPGWTILAMSGVVLGAVYTLTAYFRVMFGADRCSDVSSGADVSGLNSVLLGAFAVAVIVLGIFPKPILELIEPAVQNLVQSADQTTIDSTRLASAQPSIETDLP